MDGARGRLMDLLCNYQAIRKCCLMVVFDAYRVAGHATEVSEYHNIQVVYTKEADVYKRQAYLSAADGAELRKHLL